jgi:23S rRNA maturation-related 3'-5' exoribonuclease YhaM
MGLDAFKTEDSTSHDLPEGKVDLDREEVKRRLPHIDKILDPEIEREVIDVTASSPKYFWEVPASTSGYHHPLCRGKHGLWVHTLMVATVVERLKDTYTEQDLIPGNKIDEVRAAALLHDQRKNGPAHRPKNTSTSNHNEFMGDVIRVESELSDNVARMVDTHMGEWYDGPSPRNHSEQLLHTADMIASDENIEIDIMKPIPEELKKLGVGGYCK